MNTSYYYFTYHLPSAENKSLMKQKKNRCLNTKLGMLTEQMLACLSTESDLHKNYEQRTSAAACCMGSDKKQTAVGDQEETCQLG